MQSTLEAVIAKIDADAAADYRALVFAVAAGEAPDADKIVAVLVAANRGREEFVRHVRTAQRRLEAAQHLRRADDLDATLAELRAQAAAAREAFQSEAAKLDAAREKKLAPLRQAADHAAAAALEANREAGALRREATQVLGRTQAPEAVAEFARLSDRAVRARQAAQQAAGAIRGAGDPEALAAEVERLDAELERLRAQGKPLREVVEPLMQQLSAARAQRERAERQRAQAEAAETAAAEAESALAAWRADDWRRMNFD
jgi:DNA repair exonuclease SbcCD ATPase subunit